MNKRLIALEGLPGGGKTTIAPWLARDFDGTYIQEIVDNDSAPPDQEEYYIQSELLKLEQFATSTTEYNFLDRSFYSMLAYDYGRKKVGLSYITDQLQARIADTKKPDLFIFLRINDIQLCNYRKQRGTMEADIWTRDDSLVHIHEFYENFFDHRPNTITIETDSISVEDAHRMIMKELTNRAKTQA